MPIYTKTGDTGDTSLFGGKRVSKSDNRVEAYGSVDELNSWVGMIVSEISFPEKKDFLQKIQSDLFILGGFLAGWDNDLSALVTRVTEIEVEIDAMEETLPSLTSFILPGGSPLAAKIHVTRSICRRAERLIVQVIRSKPVEGKKKEEDIILQYVNRLSDLFFVLARFINNNVGTADIPWIGIERKSK